MMSLMSVWLGLASLMTSLAMVIYRPIFNDLVLLLEMYFACPLSLTFGGLVLWMTRKEKSQYAAAQLQAKVGIALALVAAAIVYILVASATQIQVA